MKENLDTFANRIVLLHMQTRGGLGHELPKVIEVKNKLVREFAAYIRERDDLATPEEFCRLIVLEIEKVSPIRAELVERMRQRLSGIKAFPPWYADGIEASEGMFS